MTSSAPAATTADLIEFVVCADCAIVIANDDSSGIEDADAHLAAMTAGLAGLASVVIEGPADTGFRTDECGGCLGWMGTDEWFAASAVTVSR
jgi:hypothetical protein